MKAAQFAFVALLLWGGPDEALAAEAVPGMKSGSDATLYSLAGTVFPIGVGLITESLDRNASKENLAAVLVLSGYVAGPSLGHFYAGRPVRAFTGIGIRSVALVGFAASVVSLFDESGSSNAGLVMAASLLVGAGDALVDIGQASRSARIHNERVARQKLGIGPAVIGPDHALGLRVDCAF